MIAHSMIKHVTLGHILLPEILLQGKPADLKPEDGGSGTLTLAFWVWPPVTS